MARHDADRAWPVKQLTLIEGHRKPALAQEASATSRPAAAKIEPTRSRLQTLVYRAIARAASPAGLTDQEIAAVTGLDPSTARPRRIELVEQQLVRDSGRKRPTRSRRMATVWEAVVD